MNEIANEIMSNLGIAHSYSDLGADPSSWKDFLMHYGTKRHSGRYPWGSGDSPYQHSGDFYAAMKTALSNGATKSALAKQFGMSTTEFNTCYSVAEKIHREDMRMRAINMAKEGKSYTEIGRVLGIGDTSARNLVLNADTADRKNTSRQLVDVLKEQLETKGVLDIGKGVENTLGVSRNKLDEAIFILEAENHDFFHKTQRFSRAETMAKGKTTEYVLLCKDEDAYKNAVENPEKIKLVQDLDIRSDDGGESFRRVQYPASVDSNRIQIRYVEDDGIAQDGMILLRRGCPDLSLGNSHYAQVRIMVDDSHYLKGVAAYGDDFPDGVDIIFNTNKSKDVTKMDVLKKKKSDPLNPFGASIRVDGQSTYIDPKDGKEKLSPINKLNDEGDFDTVSSKNLSSQFLSKQPLHLINQQLKVTMDAKDREFENIKRLTNPAVKQKMLLDYADHCDSAAMDMKAVGMPGQRRAVILGVRSIKDTEVYAPNYENGTKLALVRFPHAGPFEIPVLTVNNKNPEAINMITPQAKDAIGISLKTAEKLSGADFDGDTVLCLPCNNGAIRSEGLLKGLDGFDPKNAYSAHKGRVEKNKDGSETQIWVNDKTGKEFRPLIDDVAHKGKEMGKISNLITDMYLQDAPADHVARAVRHSMTVIDAAKHHLDYKYSEEENGIAELKKLYQPKTADGKGGAATLLSRRKQDYMVPERQGSGRIDPTTGKKIYNTTGRKYYDKKGNLVEAKTKSSLVLETDDLMTLSTGTAQENAYARYGNHMKALAQKARLEALNTKNIEYSAEANKKYAKEVGELNAHLDAIKRDKPRMRQVQAIANSIVRTQMNLNDDMTKDEQKKMRQSAYQEAKGIVGAQGTKLLIDLTPRQWEAIQAGAIHHTKAREILDNCDQDRVRELAMPKEAKRLTKTEIARIQRMANSGYTNAEIAKMLGYSTSTISNYASM